MKRRLLVPLITAGAALASGVASANPSYWRDNGLLLEVSADPRDGTDVVQTNPTRAGRLELVALVDAVRLRGMTVHFSDGRTFHQAMRTIRPGDRVMVDLPPYRGVIERVDLDYGPQIVDRTPARLQIIPHDDLSRYAQPSRWRDGRAQPVVRRNERARPRYQVPAPAYRSPPAYTVQPRASWSGSIQGSFRF